MKKTLLALLLALGFAFSACHKEPLPDPVTPEPDTPQPPVEQPALVTTTVLDVTATTVTARFEMGDDCTKYAFMIDDEANMAFFCSMFGCTEEEYILQFCNFFQTHDTTWTWDEQMPNKEYIILVVAHSEGADPVILRTPVTTLPQGTSDPSVITISVSDITETSARVIFTPNEATMLYKDMIIELTAIDSLGGAEGVRDFMINDDMIDEFASEDDWTWTTLEPGRTYSACAVGKNGDGVWGELCHYEFTTAGTSSKKTSSKPLRR